MNIQKNISLKKYNTFGIDVKAKLFCEVSNPEEFASVFKEYENDRILVIGGGSNILFTRDFEGLVVHPMLKGIEIQDESETQVIVKAAAGEVWDSFVEYCVNHNWGGIENLSGIPGSVGATPVQNVGAYGQEVENVIEQVEALDTRSLKTVFFSKAECCFGHRNSMFKRRLNISGGNVAARPDYLITNVYFRLDKNPDRFITIYQGVSSRLAGMEVNLRNIRDAINAIRKEKLPAPEELGNAGSFFLNTEFQKAEFLDMCRIYPELLKAPVVNIDTRVKVPSAWLIDQCGFRGKGRKEGKPAGVHENHALVLVNYGQASGTDIINLMMEIKDAVYSRFGIRLTPEVNIV